MKKISIIIINLSILLSLSLSPISALTHSTHVQDNHCDTNEITTRAALCTYCSNGYVFTSSTYTAWVSSGYYKCIHYPRGEDIKQSRKKNTTTKCNYCKKGYTSTSTEYRRGACKGYY